MRRSTLVLLACCGSLAAVTLIEIIYYDPSSDVLLTATEESNIISYIDARAGEPTFDPPPIAHFKEITGRPLFSPTRRPMSTAAKSPASTTAKLPIDIYRLRGILLSERHNIGLVERRSDGMVIRLFEGDIVDGWEVTSIEPRAIQFSDRKQIYTIRMDDSVKEESLDFGSETVIDVDSEKEIHEQNIAEQIHEDRIEEEGHEENIWQEEKNTLWDGGRDGHADDLRLFPGPRRS
jgi:hypothetical protein